MLYQLIGYRCSGAKKKGNSEESGSGEVDWEADHVAFACGELGLRLHDFYDMPWCEYLIKSYAYNRMNDNKWEHTRYTVWHILASSMVIDSKKLPSLQKFVSGTAKAIKKASEAVRNLFLEEFLQYKKDTENNTDK